MPERPGTLLADLTTLRLGGPARRLVHATTEVELRRRRAPAPTRRATPLLLVAGGSNLVVGDDGFDGTVVQIATRGVERRRGHLRRGVGHGRRRRVWDAVRGAGGERAAGSASRRCPGSPAASARPRCRTSAPTARRSPTPSPSVRCWDRVEGRQRTFAAADCGFGYRTSRFKRDPERLRRPGGHLPAPARRPRGPGALRRAGPDAGRRGRRARADGRGARRGARAAGRQGHGARRRRPRHLERRLVLHQPAARRRPGGPAARRGAALAAARRHRQDQRRVADRARRVRQGLRQRPGRPVGQAHARAHQPRRAPAPRTCWTLAGEVQAGVQAAFGVWLVNEPVLVGCALPAPTR